VREDDDYKKLSVFRKNRVTPSVNTPNDTNPIDATAGNVSHYVKVT